MAPDLYQQTFQILTFGCRLNHAESNLLEDELSKLGYTKSYEENKADLFVINSCTVTEKADQKCKKLVRSLKRQNPSAKIAVVGCYAQTSPEELFALNEVDWVLGNQEKLKLSQYLPAPCMESLIDSVPKKVFVDRFNRLAFRQPLLADYKESRVNLKIQDGCDFFCSFCVIPFARGRSRSRKWEDIHKEADHLASLGVREVILTGVNMGLYKDEGKDFLDILQGLSMIQGLERIRISSIEPTTIDGRLLELMAEPSSKIAPFLHLPIQAANNKLLKAMKRRYSLAEFDAYIKAAKAKIPKLCLGTDFITGFPLETEEDFQESFEYLASAPIDFFHVFPYSDRPGTFASGLSPKVAPARIKQRAEALRKLSQEKWSAYEHSFIGKEEAVVLEERKGDYWLGHSAHYLHVKVLGVQANRRQNIQVKILGKDPSEPYLIALSL